MPTYEYRCDACGHEFEKFQSMTAAPIRKCPDCGKSKVKRLISTGAGLIFKGSGFYITDYRSESYKDAAKADAPKSDSAAKTDAKPDSKPDAKPADSAKLSTDKTPAAPAPVPTKKASGSSKNAAR